MTHQVPDYELTPSSVEFAGDPQNHAIYCAFSKDHLHEAKCDCDLDVALIEIERAAVARVLTVERVATALHEQHPEQQSWTYEQCLGFDRKDATDLIQRLTGATHES